jgi:hypothetical protein
MTAESSGETAESAIIVNMRENPGTQLRRTGLKVRLKVAVGLGAVVAASMVAAPVASAAVPHSAAAASHSARVGSSREVLAPLAVSSSRQGARTLVITFRPPTPLWPHWGGPMVPLVASYRPPTPLWPHWGGPTPLVASYRPPTSLWPHWGGPKP